MVLDKNFLSFSLYKQISINVCMVYAQRNIMPYIIHIVYMSYIRNKENRLSVVAPGLFREVHATKNMHVDINKLTIGMTVKVWWRCAAGHEWETSVTQRYRQSTGCGKCANIKKRKRPIEVEQRVKAARLNRTFIDTVTVGDATENYVMELLRTHVDILSVEKIGQFSGSCDLIVLYRDGTKIQVQVKTLVKRVIDSGRVYYGLHMTSNAYPEAMLIVGVNTDRTKFILEYAGNIKRITVNLNWDSATGEKSMYDHMMYSDANVFLQAMVVKGRQSEPFICMEDILNPAMLKEYKMHERMKLACAEKQITYLRNETNGNTVDGTINSIPIQQKFTSSRNKSNTNGANFQVNAKKSGGNSAGTEWSTVQIQVPYDATDPFDYIVVEAGTKEGESLYPGSFCFIPKQELIKQGILKTATSPGCRAFYIYAKDHKKDHWSKAYWDRWDFFTRSVSN